MNVAYSDRAKQAGECFELIQQATGKLKETLGSAQDSVRAQWERIEDEQGRSLYSLKISDFSGEVEATFAPDDLLRGTHMRFRLAQLWGSLLQIRSRKQMDALRETGDTEVEWEIVLLQREIDELKKWKEDVKRGEEEWGRKLWMILPPVLAVFISNAITYLLAVYGKK